MLNRKSKDQKDAEQQRINKQEERRQKVYLLQPESWREEVKQYEKDLSQFVAENPDTPNHLEKWWEQKGIIKIVSIEPLIYSVKDIYGYELNQMKWDAVQTLRGKRKFAVNQEKQQAIETMPDEIIVSEMFI